MSASSVMKKTILATAAVAAIAGFSLSAQAEDAAKEKCYGVSKAGKNDCASAGHSSCAGSSKTDADPNAWISVPKGLCEKLAGGSMNPQS